MPKIQIDSGRSSAATHRLTQASTTLNRRYVRRPSNLAVDEAAHAAALREQAAPAPRVRPSRLVNLRVHAADLEKAKAAEEEMLENPEPELSTAPEINNTKENESLESSTVMTPNIVEFGRPPEEIKAETEGFAVQSSSPEDITAESLHSQNDIKSSIAEAAEDIARTEAHDAPVTYNEPMGYTEPAQYPTTFYHESLTSEPTDQPPQPPEIDTAALAASIAADYAATSLGISMKEFGNGHDSYAMSSPNGTTIDNQQSETEYRIETVESANETSATNTPNSNSVEAIALAASNAIASIREASDPDQVSEQVASLKAFSENIKSGPAMPEMRELGDTIDKFVNIAMKSTRVKEENERKVAAKVTLSPKVTRAAAKVTKSSAKVMAASNRTKVQPLSAKKRPSTPIRTNNTIHQNSLKPMTKPAMRHRPSSHELKSNAIENALRSVTTMETTNVRNRRNTIPRKKTGIKRFIIAFACATACVIAVIAFVGSNIPDISVRVAAMQTGIQASYPSYIPRDYSLGDISSEDGKITMIFNGPNNSSFKLVEEKSSWDSSALLRNYVEPSWGDEYATTHEQGITIYIANASSDAAWVNGGVLYKITSSGTPLTKKQVRSIVTSL